ncbi:MAG: tetratricopeptide repeat protein [Deltaproteobacteria bacterium]|nr:tetratricopeptide repeat protein [Deltaproteobacteria bacterium]
MYRLIKRVESNICLIAVWSALFALMILIPIGCAPKNQVIRDQLVVEQLRLRITKVRHAEQETRDVIAASRGASYLPELYMRLAELLSEEARYHYMVAYEREQRSTKSLHVPQVRFLKEQAINTYRMILQRYPDTHQADRILFNISHEQRELGMFDEMKQTLEDLIKKYGESPYRNEALLVLGDYYFDKMEFEEAKSNFSKIIEQKKSLLQGLAHYKLGWVGVNLGDCKMALSHFENAIVSSGNVDPDKVLKKKVQMRLEGDFAIPKDDDNSHQFAGHNTVNVQREALVDLTYCYAQERKPEKAVDFLRGLASTREAYVASLQKMANRYALIEQPRGAADVTRELLRLAPDDEERLDDARMLHTAVTKMKDYSSVGEDVYLVLRTMRRRLMAPNLNEASAKLVKNEMELIARDLATKSHEVLMSDDKRKNKWTDTPATYEQTALAYRWYLNSFTDSQEAVEIMQNYADVLMDAKAYLEAGRRYRKVAQMLLQPVEEQPEADNRDADSKDKATTPAAKEAKKDPPVDKKALEKARKQDRIDALYNAVVAYQKSLDQITSRSHFERAAARAGLRAAGTQYLAEAAPTGEKDRKIKFAIAQSYYDEGSYYNAIDLLTAVAYEFPKTDQGNAAVHMVLDSYRTINDISGLVNIGHRFLAKDSPIDDGLKSQIQPIVAAGEQNRLDELSLAASGDQSGGMETLLSFADRYKDSDLGERAVLSAFVAARAAGNLTQLYSLGERVLKQFPESEQAGGVVSTMGRAAAARFEFDRAIKYMEQAAGIDKEQRAALLIAAGELREQLADPDGALKNYRGALETQKEGTQAVSALVHMVDILEKRESADSVIKEIKKHEDILDAELSSRLGLALLKKGENYDAEDQLRKVVEGAVDASPQAQARANYGMAEINLRMLEEFGDIEEIGMIEELIGVIDVTVQSYLAAVRQVDPIYSQAALARLSRATELGAEKLETVSLPSELSDEEKAMVKQALSARAKQLRVDSQEVLAECAQRARNSFLLDEAGRACLMGKPPVKDPVKLIPLKSRSSKGAPKGSEAYQDRLSKNPEDLEALRYMGKAFLDAGDAHAARLVLARTIEAGGDAEDLNRLGVACYRSGDLMGALDAFKRSMDAQSVAAIKNLSIICDDLGLRDLSRELSGKIKGEITGDIIRGGGK